MSIDTVALKNEIHQVIAAGIPLIPGIPAFADGIIESIADSVSDAVVDLVIAKLFGPASPAVAATIPKV